MGNLLSKVFTSPQHFKYILWPFLFRQVSLFMQPSQGRSDSVINFCPPAPFPGTELLAGATARKTGH